MSNAPDIRRHLPRGAQAKIAAALRRDRSYVNRMLADPRRDIGEDIKRAAAEVARFEKRRRAFDFWFPPTD